jgi:archaellum biogenesis protein FlaJ (TadC family)
MTIMDVLILLGLILIIFGCGFFILAIIMERHYDRKLWELDKQKQDEKWRKEYKMIELSASLGVLIILISIVYMGLFL